jgi:hypothetical protein
MSLQGRRMNRRNPKLRFADRAAWSAQFVSYRKPRTGGRIQEPGIGVAASDMWPVAEPRFQVPRTGPFF